VVEVVEVVLHYGVTVLPHLLTLVHKTVLLLLVQTVHLGVETEPVVEVVVVVSLVDLVELLQMTLGAQVVKVVSQVDPSQLLLLLL
jgi:hypothetical protein